MLGRMINAALLGTRGCCEPLAADLTLRVAPHPNTVKGMRALMQAMKRAMAEAVNQMDDSFADVLHGDGRRPRKPREKPGFHWQIGCAGPETTYLVLRGEY